MLILVIGMMEMLNGKHWERTQSFSEISGWIVVKPLQRKRLRIFQSYRPSIVVGPDVGSSATKQAALLTAVNTGRRCFLGGVEVHGLSDAELLIPWRDCRTIAQAVADL